VRQVFELHSDVMRGHRAHNARTGLRACSSLTLYHRFEQMSARLCFHKVAHRGRRCPLCARNAACCIMIVVSQATTLERCVSAHCVTQRTVATDEAADSSTPTLAPTCRSKREHVLRTISTRVLHGMAVEMLTLCFRPAVEACITCIVLSGRTGTTLFLLTADVTGLWR
jgi:hypothetical protein